MDDSTLYSIGHGNKKLDEFINELNAFDIKYLLDIRSKPFSKWNPHFNRARLDIELNNNGITYVFVGDTLGGLPDDRSCYDAEGKVVYDIIKEKDFFKRGIERLLTANEKKVNLAIMCSESKPDQCHRSKLIGKVLLDKKISLNHIVSNDKVKPQEVVMNEITKGKGMVDLFGEQAELTSRKSY